MSAKTFCWLFWSLINLKWPLQLIIVCRHKNIYYSVNWIDNELKFDVVVAGSPSHHILWVWHLAYRMRFSKTLFTKFDQKCSNSATFKHKTIKIKTLALKAVGCLHSFKDFQTLTFLSCVSGWEVKVSVRQIHRHCLSWRQSCWPHPATPQGEALPRCGVRVI